jgi:hypothetical protein
MINGKLSGGIIATNFIGLFANYPRMHVPTLPVMSTVHFYQFGAVTSPQVSA